MSMYRVFSCVVGRECLLWPDGWIQFPRGSQGCLEVSTRGRMINRSGKAVKDVGLNRENTQFLRRLKLGGRIHVDLILGLPDEHPGFFLAFPWISKFCQKENRCKTRGQKVCLLREVSAWCCPKMEPQITNNSVTCPDLLKVPDPRAQGMWLWGRKTRAAKCGLFNLSWECSRQTSLRMRGSDAVLLETFWGQLHLFLGFPGNSDHEESACQSRRLEFNTWVRKIPLEQEMATHSSIFAWEIPWTEEPGGLESTGSQRLGHDWAHTHTHTHTPILCSMIAKCQRSLINRYYLFFFQNNCSSLALLCLLLILFLSFWLLFLTFLSSFLNEI